MRVVALVGKSGTGKSYKALSLAHEKEINCIIDDGLFIKGRKIIAGRSAKREKTKIAAVKRALFMNKQHRENVIEKLKEHNPPSILLIGTSEKMVNQISENLKIAPIDEIVYIDQIASEEEIKIARESRMKQGKHVIPVPTFELKKDFSGYFIDRLKIFGRKKDNTLQIAEKSVVRPTFSYMGRFTIYDRAIVQIVRHVIEDVESIYKINRIKIINNQSAITINIELVLKFGFKIPDTIASIQKLIKREVEHMTSLNITAINIVIKSLQINY
ncbi:Asp23/Gls24 family envelope stress response protein [Wukongibacter baidiensis]|uniref:Asp23/Gls24 family envelope stress response protein n=1 Tax=Wukongibacter baidiensis TaxID=1723361 RepID=UPI003D7F4642